MSSPNSVFHFTLELLLDIGSDVRKPWHPTEGITWIWKTSSLLTIWAGCFFFSAMLTALRMTMLDWHSWSSEDELYCLWWPQVLLILWYNSTGQIWYRQLWLTDDRPDKQSILSSVSQQLLDGLPCSLPHGFKSHWGKTVMIFMIWLSPAVLIRMKNSKMCMPHVCNAARSQPKTKQNKKL